MTTCNMTKSELEILELFNRLLDECDSSEEFSLRCAMNGYGELATRSFFDNKLFPILFAPYKGRGAELRLIIALNSRLWKLQRYYKDLLDDLDI